MTLFLPKLNLGSFELLKLSSLFGVVQGLHANRIHGTGIYDIYLRRPEWLMIMENIAIPYMDPMGCGKNL